MRMTIAFTTISRCNLETVSKNMELRKKIKDHWRDLLILIVFRADLEILRKVENNKKVMFTLRVK